jgi:hypothetical protein
MNKDYNSGYDAGAKDAQNQDDILSFGAIRRAAEVARTYEAFAASGFYKTSEERALKIRAESIRHAIRAAIGSDKV